MREIRIIFMSIAAALIVSGAGSFVHGELVVHYPFDDGTAMDISGNGNHGNIVGNVAMAFDSERGNVMYFPGGNNHYIRVPASPSLNAVAASYTMAVWLKRPADTVGQLLEKGGTGGSAWYEPPWGVRLESDGLLRLNWGNTAWYTNSSIPLQTWTHVAIVFDASLPSNQRKVYIDGVLDAESDWAAASTNTYDLFIGTDWYNGVSRWGLNAYLSDLRIFNTALSETDIITLMTGMGVTDIEPPNGAIRVPVDQVLSWNPPAVEDPNFVITGYDVYFDPNRVKVAEGDSTVKVASNQPETTYDPGVLDYVKTYYWRVDVIGQYDYLPDPNIFPGAVFSFTTMSLAPEIISQPVDQVRGPANGKPDAVLAVEALNATHYQWYKDDAPIAGATEPTLTIIGVQPSDEGQYYCVVSNIDSPTEIRSNTVWIEYARLTSRWDFEQTLTDSIGGYDGLYFDPNESPGVFSTDSWSGDYAVQFEGDNEWVELPAAALPRAGTEMTFAFWAKNFTPSVGTTTLYASADAAPGDRLINIHTPWSNNNAYLDVSNPDAGGSYDRVSAGSAVDLAAEPYWIYWVFTKDTETGVMRIYRNGQRVGQSTGQLRRYYGADRFFLGANRNADNEFGQFFNGLIDDLRIYNYAMNELETAYLYYDMTGEKVCVDPADPVLAAYDFNGNCKIDLGDVAELAGQWLTCQRVPDCIERP